MCPPLKGGLQGGEPLPAELRHVDRRFTRKHNSGLCKELLLVRDSRFFSVWH
jgi:hypothetical protein